MRTLVRGVGLGAWLVYGISVALHLFITFRYRVRISISLVKHCSSHDVKESVKSAWTNIGLTTSLVMTTVIGALIEGHEITPQGFCMDHPSLLHTQQIYVALCVACLFANVNCIIYCVLNLFYWDALSEEDAIVFLRENPQVLGETVIYMVESYIFFIAAIATWIYGTYGITFLTGIFVSFALSAAINLSNVWANLDKFNPKDPKAQCAMQRPCCRACGGLGADAQQWIRVMESLSDSKKESPQSSDDNDAKSSAPKVPAFTEVRSLEKITSLENDDNDINDNDEGLSEQGFTKEWVV
eukprot:Skav235964  [mRNA]  locus=scaffold592:102916:103809:- [translate_table: standard]